MKLFTLSALFTLLLLSSTLATCTHAKSWRKGQVHTHANNIVPQLPWTSPDVPADWYRTHGYNFVTIADLNYVTPVDGIKSVYDAPGRFIVVPGIELSAEPKGMGVQIIDTLGIGVRSNIDMSGIATGTDTSASTVDVLNSQIRAIKRAGGLPIVAHPSLTYAIDADDFIALDDTRGPIFFEVYNAEPGMNNLGGGGKPSTESIWDTVLSTGRLMYGVASDDSHHFFTWIDSSIPNQQLANPGKAWIQVRSDRLTWHSLRSAMEDGDFYATTGIKLLDYQVTDIGITIELDDTTKDLGWSVDGSNPQLYTTTFIGKDGMTLKIDESLTPSYEFTEDDLYVRAKIVSSDGSIALTQPVFPSH
jgi:hypothetical protein